MLIGYIGLGEMGGPLARRLQGRHELLVHDLNPVAVEQMVNAGASAAGSIAEVGRRCDLVFLCLPTSAHVRSVIFTPEGLGETMASGAMIVDQTSGDPRETRDMAEGLSGIGIGLVDAPVSGGPKGAEAGTIAIMVGATDDQYAGLAPILSAISGNLFHAGPVGSGHTIKLVNNLISTATRLLTFEAMALAVKNGMDANRAFEILMASGGRNSFMERMLGPHILKGDLSAGYTLGLAHKDVRLACQLGSDSGVPLFLGNLTRELYQMYMNELGSGAKVDMAALIVDRMAGTSIVPSPQ